MALVSLVDARLAYGHVALLDGAGIAIEPGERVGLIGRNGSGKTSLLRVLAGLADPDAGTLSRASGTTTAFVAQEPAFDPGIDVFAAVAGGLPHHSRLLADYERTVEDLARHADDPLLADRLHALQDAIEAAGAWSMQQRVHAVLSRLGLDGAAVVDTLSGGTRKRVALARAIVAEPDLLLLDEPTNHLDLDAIAWLEELLLAHRGAVVVVTHDRAFLDRVATRIVELDRGRLRSYPGNFAAYRRAREAELEAERTATARFDRLLAQEEAWIRKGVEARRTRNEGRVRRLEALRRARAERREQAGRVRLALAEGERSGKLVAELRGVHKSFDGRCVARDLSLTVLRGDRIGVIGPNGAGKTTLLRILLGELPPDHGTVRLGTRVSAAYFDQMRERLDEDASLADTISPGADWIEIGGERKHVMSYLGEFLFPPERARSPVRTLSGGERNRLLLARLFARPANVLVLDEPTNDLDIETLELLEDLLQDYAGTVLLVSHDRAFLDNVVTQTLAFEGDGRWREYVGGYEDWLRQRPATGVQPDARTGAARDGAPRAPAAKASRSGPAASAEAAAPAGPAPAPPRPRLTRAERRELESLPQEIEALEREQKAIARDLEDPEYFGRDPEVAVRASRRYAEIEAALLERIARWEHLETRRSG